MVINGDVFELANEGGIKMTLFEYVFGSSLDEIMKKTAGSTERSFKMNDVEYNYKNKLYLNPDYVFIYFALNYFLFLFYRSI